MKILIIEDDIKILTFVKKGLEEAGYVVETASDGEDGLYLSKSRDYEVIVLDLNLPKIDGLEILAELRGQGLQTPILCLTARDRVEDRVKGLEAGADDYLVKPFAFSELLARIHAVTRRGESQNLANLIYADISMNLVTRVVERNSQAVEFTPKEFSILEYFLRNPERVLSRTVIGERIWGSDSSVYSNVIDAHVKNIRKKLNQINQKEILHTIKSVGYVLRK